MRFLQGLAVIALMSSCVSAQTGEISFNFSIIVINETTDGVTTTTETYQNETADSTTDPLVSASPLLEEGLIHMFNEALSGYAAELASDEVAAIEKWLRSKYNSTYYLGFKDVTIGEEFPVAAVRADTSETTGYRYYVTYDFATVESQNAFDDLAVAVLEVQDSIYGDDICSDERQEIEPGLVVDCTSTGQEPSNQESAINSTVTISCEACAEWEVSCAITGYNNCTHKCDFFETNVRCNAGLGIVEDSAEVTCSLDGSYEPQFTCSCEEDIGSLIALGVLMSDADEDGHVTCYSMTMLTIIIGCVGGGLILILVLVVIFCCCRNSMLKKQNQYTQSLDRQDAFEPPSKPPPFSTTEGNAYVADDDLWSDVHRSDPRGSYHPDDDSPQIPRSDKRLVVGDYDNKAFEPTAYQDEAILSKDAYRDFRASVAHVDPRVEYKIKRPTYHIRPGDDMTMTDKYTAYV